MSLIENAKRLSSLISESDECIRYKDAEIKFLNDINLQNSVKKYKEMYSNYMKNKSTVLGEKIDSLYNELLSNSIYTEYLKSKADFEGLVRQVHEVIDYKFNYNKKSCCNNKNNCNGCSNR